MGSPEPLLPFPLTEPGNLPGFGPPPPAEPEPPVLVYGPGLASFFAGLPPHVARPATPTELASFQLRCEMSRECSARVTHLGEKGFIYCEPHARQRTRAVGERTRALSSDELATLHAGGRVERFE